MRVYLPATMSGVERLWVDREYAPPGGTGFAVTSGMREWYVDDNLEELEYAAMIEAARASLRLLDAEPDAARRRVVIAADVEDARVSVRDDIDRGVVRVAGLVPLSAVAAVHVDDAGAETAIGVAAGSVVAADLGDERAQDRVDDAEGFELSWYASQEIGTLLGR